MKHVLSNGQTLNIDSRADAIIKVDVDMADGTKFSVIVSPGSTFTFTAGDTGAVLNANIYSPSLNATGILN